MITIVHGGQTGVDRGAHEIATELGWPVDGYMPKDKCDELGPIPNLLALQLRTSRGGLKTRTEDNLNFCHALLAVVADKQDPYATPGTRLTLAYARQIERPRMVVDPTSLAIDIVGWIRMLEPKLPRDWRLMVAGPRESRWTDGRIQTARLLRMAAPLMEKR